MPVFTALDCRILFKWTTNVRFEKGKRQVFSTIFFLQRFDVTFHLLGLALFQINNGNIVSKDDGIKKQFSTNDSILVRLDVSYYLPG